MNFKQFLIHSFSLLFPNQGIGKEWMKVHVKNIVAILQRN